MSLGSDQTLDAPLVLLTGASSQIGVFAIPRLLAAGFRVLAVSRKGRPRSYPDFEQVRWMNVPGAMSSARDCQYFLSAGPMALAQEFLAGGHNFRTVCVFSSSSVESKQHSASRAERQQIEGMLALESKLKLASQEKGVKLVIFRPTLIYGCGLDTNVSRLANWIQRFGFMPVNGPADGLRQPVHADDLASVATTALLSDKSLPEVLTVCGGNSIKYTDMVERIFVAMGKPVRLLRLPGWLFIVLVRLAGMLRPSFSINSEMVKRQRRDLVFDDQHARQLLGYQPRPFVPQMADFYLPANFSDISSP